MVLEGTYNGYSNIYTGSSTIYIVVFPGPDPYTETHASVAAYVGDALEKIGQGKKVRITVEEAK